MRTEILKVLKSEVPEGKAKTFKANNTKIIISNCLGRFYAVEDVCSHDEGEILNGECELVEECQIECPRHGARFDVTSGRATKMPAVAPIAVFEIQENGDELSIHV